MGRLIKDGRFGMRPDDCHRIECFVRWSVHDRVVRRLGPFFFLSLILLHNCSDGDSLSDRTSLLMRIEAVEWTTRT